jgi:hypothetical protein
MRRRLYPVGHSTHPWRRVASVRDPAGTPPAGHTGPAGSRGGQAVAVSWPHVQGSQLHGLQVHFGLEQVVEAAPQLQSTQVHGSQVHFGLEQVLGSAVVIGAFLTSGWASIRTEQPDGNWQNPMSHA